MATDLKQREMWRQDNNIDADGDYKPVVSTAFGMMLFIFVEESWHILDSRFIIVTRTNANAPLKFILRVSRTRNFLFHWIEISRQLHTNLTILEKRKLCIENTTKCWNRSIIPSKSRLPSPQFAHSRNAWNTIITLQIHTRLNSCTLPTPSKKEDKSPWCT